MRLLLIEDDIKIARFVRTGLQEAGYIVDHAANGEDNLHFFVTETIRGVGYVIKEPD